MKIAVLADTHDRLPAAVIDQIRAADVDEIWHLGDVTRPSVLDDLLTVSASLRVVRGNCDHAHDWPLTIDRTISGICFRLQHIPPAARQCPADIDILLHGHTHVPRDETVSGIRFLNPGAIGKSNRGAPPSFAFLTVSDGRVGWEVRQVF
ncbi:MAG: metallophosphatase family protein [Verrucomicrobiales bacterium]|jgi:putative phosphoesterase|nr:metallophosphatase family protein [Verrucomicrobiales bacterium]